MEVKEKARFLASPKYAYGPLGIPGVCDPSKSQLHCTPRGLTPCSIDKIVISCC